MGAAWVGVCTRKWYMPTVKTTQECTYSGDTVVGIYRVNTFILESTMLLHPKPHTVALSALLCYLHALCHRQRPDPLGMKHLSHCCSDCPQWACRFPSFTSLAAWHSQGSSSWQPTPVLPCLSPQLLWQILNSQTGGLSHLHAVGHISTL